MQEGRKADNGKIGAQVRAFFDGGIFPVALGALVFLFYAVKLPVVALAICFACAAYVCFFGRDTRPALAAMLLAMLSFRYKDCPKQYETPFAIAVYAVLGGALLAAMAYRLIKRRVAWRKKSGTWSTALFCGALLVGGVGSSHYSLGNFAYAIGFSSAAMGTYLFFALTMEKRGDNLLYLARVLAVSALLICAQFLLLYLRVVDLDGGSWKGKLILGWTIGNMAADMLVFTLPAVFYLVYEEKYGYLYWGVIFAVFVTVYFSLCRNALIWGVLTVFTGALVNCLVGRNKKYNRYAVVGGGVVLATLAIFLYSTGNHEKWIRYYAETGFSDNGRFQLWEAYARLFAQSPLNGVGFKSYSPYEGVILMAHNTPLQMLASSGIIGLAGYLTHRVQTISLVVEKPTPERLFFGGCILLSVLLTVVSSTFFHIYFIVYYVIVLLTLEKSL